MELLIVGVLVVTLFPAGVLYRRFIGRVWMQAASSLGLNRNLGSPKTSTWIGGPVRGAYVDVRMVPGGRRGWFTTYKVTYESAGPDVRFRRQGRLSFLRRLIGGRDVLIGDANFDDAVIVDTTDFEAVTTFLTPARNAAILAVFGQWGTAEIGQNSIQARTRHIERSADRIVASVNQLIDTALLFATPIEDVEPLIDEVAKDPMAIDADSFVVDWREVHNRQAPTTPTDAGSDGAMDEIGEIDLSQDAVVHDLLNTNLMGFEIEARFANSYEGRVVTWSGEIETIRDFRNDADLGETRCTRVSVRIGRLDNSSFVSKQVYAVLTMPTNEGLTKGDNIRFTGSLLRIDRHTRKVHLVDARLADITTTSS